MKAGGGGGGACEYSACRDRKRASDFPGAGVPDGRELPGVGNENQARPLARAASALAPNR